MEGEQPGLGGGKEDPSVHASSASPSPCDSGERINAEAANSSDQRAETLCLPLGGEEQEPKKKEEEEEGEEGEGKTENGAAPASSWFYIDDEGKEQGPFPQSHIKTWWQGGYLPRGLRIRKELEKDFSSITDRDEFKSILPAPSFPYSATGDPSSAGYMVNPRFYAYGYKPNGASVVHQVTAAPSPAGQTAQPSDYLQSYHSQHGPAPASSDSSPETQTVSKPLTTSAYTQRASFNARTGKFQADNRQWGHTADRQMAHYFDVDAWQDQMQSLKKVKRKNPKIDWRAYKKKKKLEKRKRQILHERQKDNEML